MAVSPPGPPLKITCPSCGAKANAPATVVGRTVRCGRCQVSFRVPDPRAAGLAVPAPTQAEAAPAPRPTIAEAVAPAPADETEWNVGDVVLGLYEVTDVLGQGGMGRVYRVRHRGWDVDLAVKVPLAKALEAAGGAEAFEREAETWVNLGLHPHTVSCYYVRRVEGVPRVFAEYVDGGSLQDAIQGRRLVTADAMLDVAIQFAWGLHYAHEQGLVHRDVKPGNLMLTADRVAKVTDFGLARARVSAPMPAGAQGSGDHTTMAPGGAGGTPGYMSPEQWAGKNLTRGTDVWSWALCVLEMFVGGRIWKLGPAAPFALEQALGAPAEMIVPLPEPVSELLRRCLDTEPGRRPRTLAEAADALVAAYPQITGRTYARSSPHGGRATADSLNNRAVSLLDLGRTGADGLWAQALRAEPQHLESSYNQALHAWGQGRIGDEELLARVEEAKRTNAQVPRAAELLAQAKAAAIGAGGLAESSRAVKADAPVAVAVTPDGSRVLAFGKAGGEVRVWKASGEALRPLAPVELKVRAMAVAPDGKALLLAGEGAPPQLWDMEAGRATRQFPRVPGITTCLAITGDGRLAVVAGSDRKVRVFETATGRQVHALDGHTEAVACVAVTADGSKAASGGLDETVRVWDIAAGKALATLRGHRGRVDAIAFAADGSVLLSGGEDRTVRQWDLAGGASTRVLEGPTGAVTSILLGPDARQAIVASHDRTIRAWDLGRGTLRGVARLEGPIHDLAGAGELRSVWAVSGAGLREVRLSAAQWRPQYALARPISVVEAEHRSAAFMQRLADARNALTQGDLGRALTLAREARTVPGHERAEAALSLWDDVTAQLPKKSLQSAWEAAALEGHHDPVMAVAASADGAIAISGDLAGGVRWWDLRQQIELAQPPGHQATVTSAALAPDGRHAVTASWDRTLKTWEVGKDQAVRTLEGHTDYVNAVALSPSGRTALSASSDQTLRLWDVASGRHLGTLQGHEGPVSACAFGPDGKFALSASWDTSLRLWDVQARAAVGALEGHETSVGAVVLSPDGRQAASGGLDGVARLWDLRLRRSLRALTGHTAEITALAYLPDGRYLLTGSRDKSVKVWDVTTGACVRTLPFTGAVLSLAVLRSGNAFLCAGTDLALRLWRLEWETDERAMRQTFQTAPKARSTLQPSAQPASSPTAPTVPIGLPKTGPTIGPSTDAPIRLKPVTMAPTLRPVRADTTAWDDIRKAAPRAAAREAAVQAARSARRALPSAKTVGLVAAVALALVVGIVVFRPRHASLGVSRHQTDLALKEINPYVVDLAPFASGCADGYEQYLERSRARVVSEETLACLLQAQQPGLVDTYLETVSIEDSELTIFTRKRRNAVSLMVGLGGSAIPDLCRWVAGGSDAGRWVASRALAADGSEAAADCLINVAQQATDPSGRAAALEGLRLMLARKSLKADKALDAITAGTQDTDPRVQQAAVKVLAMLDFDHADPLLAAMETSATPEGAAAAKAMRERLTRYRKLNPDLPY
jgi:WD40 repeat protein/serine/threonine protein kinase